MFTGANWLEGAAALVLTLLITSIEAADSGNSSVNVHINDHNDFCLFGPAEPGRALGLSEGHLVSWCTDAQDGGRLIPQGALTGVTVVKTDKWVQVSGVGDLTKLNLLADDVGAQLDSAGHKPENARVEVNGRVVENWVSMMTSDTFCFRACLGDDSYCPTDLADQGCYVMLSNAVGWAESFRTCHSDAGAPPSEQGSTAPEWRDCQEGSIPAGEDSGDGSSAPSVVTDQALTPTPTEEWVPVETCVPCQEASPGNTSGEKPDVKSASTEETIQAANPARPTSTSISAAGRSGTAAPLPSASPSGSGEPGANPTSQQGVSPIHSDAPSGDDSQSSPADAMITEQPLNDLMLRRAYKRQDPPLTVTKNGKCCHTTWTQAGASTAPSSLTSSLTGTPASGTRAAATGTGLITAANGTGSAGTPADTSIAGSSARQNATAAGASSAALGADVTAAGKRNVTVDGSMTGKNGTGDKGSNKTSEQTSWAIRGRVSPQMGGDVWITPATMLLGLFPIGMYTLL